jgi:hypothetical protein
MSAPCGLMLLIYLIQSSLWKLKKYICGVTEKREKLLHITFKENKELHRYSCSNVLHDCTSLNGKSCALVTHLFSLHSVIKQIFVMHSFILPNSLLNPLFYNTSDVCRKKKQSNSG